jgi:hypothetical protein
MLMRHATVRALGATLAASLLWPAAIRSQDLDALRLACEARDAGACNTLSVLAGRAGEPSGCGGRCVNISEVLRNPTKAQREECTQVLSLACKLGIFP